MAIHKNATAIFKLWKMPLQFLQTLENATTISNFEKRHSRLQKMPLEMAWNGIFQSLEIAVAFLGYTRFGVTFIKLTQKKNNWASCWVPDVSRSLCNSLVYWLRWQWHGTQMSEIHYEEPFFIGFYIDIHLFFKSVWMWLEISGLKTVQTAPTYAKFRIIF